jgi:hypothetical protein
MAGTKWQTYVKILENNKILKYRDVVDVEVTLTARQQKSKSQKLSKIWVLEYMCQKGTGSQILDPRN